MSATNSVNKSSFIAVAHLFTCLRMNMGPNGLNNTMVLHPHKERLDQLFGMASDFVHGCNYWKTVLRTFDAVEL